MGVRVFCLLFVTLSLCLTATLAKKTAKQAKGTEGCKENDKATFRGCLEIGFASRIEGCEAGTAEKEMKGKDLKKCKATEGKLIKCGYSCDEEKSQLIKKCGHEDKNYPGADLFYKVHLSIEDCVEECQGIDSCKSITYRTAERRCYIKSMKGGASGPTVNAGDISTNMDCDRSDIDLSCVREDLGYYGSDIRNLRSEGIEDCALLCRDTENCQAITFRDSDNHCWLKSSRGGTGPYPLAGHRSLNMGCDKGGTEIDLKCLREGIEFYAADLRNLAVYDAAECAIHCSDTEACKGFMYRDSDHQCYLKSKRGGAYPRAHLGHRSMNMECDNSKVKHLDCLRKGFDFPGATIGGRLEVADEEECVKHCRDTEDCVSITFRESDNGCFLRHRRGGDGGPNPHAGHNSMNLECDNGPVKNLHCMREGIWFYGADLRNFIVDDEKECVRHCRDTELCKAISYRDSDNRCYLKSRQGGNAPQVAPGHRSMNMECDNSKVTNLNCFREGYDFPGAHMGNLVVADEEECVRRCRDTEGCRAVTYSAEDKRCWLRNRRGGGSVPRADSRYKSMNMECDNSRVTLECLRRGVDFPGAVIGNLIVSDESECVRHCRDTEDCKSLTFRESDHMCYLRSRHGGSYVNGHPGHNSLNMECENGKLEDLKCPVEDETFPGHDLRNAVVEDVQACLQWCRDTQDCVAASFNEVDYRCYMKTTEFQWWMFKHHYKSFNIKC